MDGLPCLTIEYGEVFRTTEYASTFVAIICLVICLTDVGIVGSLGNVTTSTVNTARCSLTDEFCMSVTVKVIDHKLRIMGPGTDVLS